jgi:glycosyltransferase involved in cell wall biosynthesis
MGGRIIALIPAYNEAETITPVIIKTINHLPVLVVDDGSADQTADIAGQASAQVIKLVENQGKGAALQAGFRRAIDQGYTAIVTLDADGQHDPDEIPQLIKAFETTCADLIIGMRDFSDMPVICRLAKWSEEVAFSWAMGQEIHNNQSGFRLLSSRMANEMLTSYEGGFELEVEMIVICIRTGFTLDWVPIRTIYAGEASHINPLQHTRNFLRMVQKTRAGRPSKQIRDG